jgi:hypothetical protein
MRFHEAIVAESQRDCTLKFSSLLNAFVRRVLGERRASSMNGVTSATTCDHDGAQSRPVNDQAVESPGRVQESVGVRDGQRVGVGHQGFAEIDPVALEQIGFVLHLITQAGSGAACEIEVGVFGGWFLRQLDQRR